MHADRWLPCQKNIVRPDNRLLRLLDEDTYKNLLPHLEILTIPNGHPLGASGDTLDYVYFPISCVLNIQDELADGSTAELTAISRNGFLGASALTGGGAAGSSAFLPATSLRSRRRSGSTMSSS